jgi:hypothetical protein
MRGGYFGRMTGRSIVLCDSVFPVGVVRSRAAKSSLVAKHADQMERFGAGGAARIAEFLASAESVYTARLADRRVKSAVALAY